MADITEIGQVNIPRDTTIKELIEAENLRNAYLAIIAEGSREEVLSSYTAIQRIVRNGLAPQVFDIGDQINTKYTYNGTEYEWPFDVVSFEDVELEDGEVVPGMILQGHYCTPYSLTFDAREALYYAENGLSAGTYNFTLGSQSWCSDDVGKTFQFTLTKAVPAGGQICTNNSYNATMEGATVSTYESAESSTAIESATMTEGSGGTSLGTTNNSTVTDEMNQCQRMLGGYNRWSQSAMRQWLNSKDDNWWEPQNNFDRVPSELASRSGFMAGFEDDFLNILIPTKIITSRNTIVDDGGNDETFDKFFAASIEQLNINPQASGVEGSAWDYWKRATGSEGFIDRDSTAGTFPVTYAINAQTSAQNVRTRSASRGIGASVWTVISSGGISATLASSAYRVSPACVIC